MASKQMQSSDMILETNAIVMSEVSKVPLKAYDDESTCVESRAESVMSDASLTAASTGYEYPISEEDVHPTKKVVNPVFEPPVEPVMLKTVMEKVKPANIDGILSIVNVPYTNEDIWQPKDQNVWSSIIDNVNIMFIQTGVKPLINRKWALYNKDGLIMRSEDAGEITVSHILEHIKHLCEHNHAHKTHHKFIASHDELFIRKTLLVCWGKPFTKAEKARKGDRKPRKRSGKVPDARIELDTIPETVEDAPEAPTTPTTASLPRFVTDDGNNSDASSDTDEDEDDK